MNTRSRNRGARPRGLALGRTARERSELKVIYVVAEGEGTEYDYLSHLDRRYGREFHFRLTFPSRNRQRNGLHLQRVVEEAARMVGETGIDQVWALFDHDARPDIPQVCAEARRRGVHTALSHPAFELWLLLHFPNRIPAPQRGRNADIINRLRAADGVFDDYGPHGKRITDRRFGALAGEGGGTVAEAVKQARLLVGRCPSGCGCSKQIGHTQACSPDKRDPSTDVYLLVETLGIAPRSGVALQ